ncbi:hypothetical protein ACP3V8_24950, partial [Salmonella enterica]
RQTLRTDVHNSLQDLGALTTSNIKNWLEGRIQLLESLGQQVAANGTEKEQLARSIGLPVYGQRFQLSYFGG